MPDSRKPTDAVRLKMCEIVLLFNVKSSCSALNFSKSWACWQSSYQCLNAAAPSLPYPDNTPKKMESKNAMAPKMPETSSQTCTRIDMKFEELILSFLLSLCW